MVDRYRPVLARTMLFADIPTLKRSDPKKAMSTFDRQITSAARQLDEMIAQKPSMFEAGDAMHALIVVRADTLMGCTEGSPEEEELPASVMPSKHMRRFGG